MEIKTLSLKFVSITLLLFLWTGVASAHKLNVFAYMENNTLVGEAYFNDGAPARHSAIHVKNAKNNSLIVEGTTDEKQELGLFYTTKQTYLSAVVKEESPSSTSYLKYRF